MRRSDDTDIRETLGVVRGLFESRGINEDASQDEGDAIPYGKDDELYNNTINAARTQFGADFTGCENPMLYYPSNGDVVFSGRIPTLNDAKFQFHYLDGTQGCYLWFEPIALNDDSLAVLNKISGVFKNWRKELETATDIKPMSYKQTQN